MNELKGRKILTIEVGMGEQFIRFTTDAGPLMYEAEGDCCSETWFAEIIGVNALLNQQVTGVSELELERNDTHTRQEFDAIYGFELITKKGRGQIVFRNSSNGYYGGYLVLVTAGEPICKWKNITDDWDAYK